jgi:hypothetical protein
MISSVKLSRLIFSKERTVKRKTRFALLPLIAGAINLICGCTSNPFGDDEISEEKRTISGVAQLADQSNAKGIMVWMAGFNISTFTDESGAFKITLPPQGSQGPAGGLSGVLNMYFFVGNYLLDYAQVGVQGRRQQGWQIECAEIVAKIFAHQHRNAAAVGGKRFCKPHWRECDPGSDHRLGHGGFSSLGWRLPGRGVF